MGIETAPAPCAPTEKALRCAPPGTKPMHHNQPSDESSGANRGQAITVATDVRSSPMENVAKMSMVVPPSAPGHHERRRTVVALVSASIISLVVWGLILALKIQ